MSENVSVGSAESAIQEGLDTSNSSLESSKATRDVTSWARKYFEKKEVKKKDRKTGEERSVLSDVCTLPSEENPDRICGADYKHNLSSGTKSITRHLLNVHKSNPQIAAEILTLNLAKVLQKI